MWTKYVLCTSKYIVCTLYNVNVHRLLETHSFITNTYRIHRIYRKYIQ